MLHIVLSENIRLTHINSTLHKFQQLNTYKLLILISQHIFIWHLSRCLNYSRGECTPYFQSVGRRCDSTSLDWTGRAGVRWGKTMTILTMTIFLTHIGSTWWGRGLGKAASTWLQWKRVRCRQWRGLGCLQALKWKSIRKWIHEKPFILGPFHCQVLHDLYSQTYFS